MAHHPREITRSGMKIVLMAISFLAMNLVIKHCNERVIIKEAQEDPIALRSVGDAILMDVLLHITTP